MTISSELVSLRVLLREQALVKARAHARSDLENEVGGVLLGRFFRRDDQLLVLIVGVVPAVKAVGGPLSLHLTPGAWADMLRCIDTHPEYGKDDRWRIVGWYHTHPGSGLNLSDADSWIHRMFFVSPAHVALVIDPIEGSECLFCWDVQHVEVVQHHRDKLIIIDDARVMEWLSDGGESTDCCSLPQAEVRGSGS